MSITLILTAVKKSLRISSSHFDEDISELIQTAKDELRTAGATTTDESKPLIRQAIKFYCRANFQNGDPAERELYQKRFDKLKDTIALCGIYGDDEDDEGNDDNSDSGNS